MKRRTWSRSLVRTARLSWFGNHAGSLTLVFIALLAFAFSSINPQGVERLRSGTADMFAPALQIISKPIQDSAAFVRGVSGLAEMQAENQRLSKENMRLREWYQTALVLEAENRSLRDLLNLKLEAQNSYITAHILSDSGNTFVKSLLVSVGKKDGVKKGQAVISGDGVVGRIIEVGNDVSRVLLLTDINSRVPVMVENTSQHAVLAGDNDQIPTLVHLPPDSEVPQGARIITSGHGGLFPQGLPVGQVQYSPDHKPQVQLFADFDRMVYVRIVNRPEDPNLRPRQTEP